MRNLVLTGAAGQLGQAFVEHFAKHDQLTVHALDLSFEKTAKIEGVHYETVNITEETEVVSFSSPWNRSMLW